MARFPFPVVLLLLLALPLQAQQAGNDTVDGASNATSGATSGEPAPTPTPDPKRPIKMSLTSPFASGGPRLSVPANWGHWIPIQVTLSNTGEPVSGRLELRLTVDNDPGVRASVAYTDVDLPTVSNKQVWLYARYDNDFNSGEVNFSGRGFRGLTSSFDLRKKDAGTRIVLSVNAAGEKMSGLLNLKKPESLGIKAEIDEEKRQNQGFQNFGGSQANKNAWAYDMVLPLATNHRGLPSRWVGLQMADAIVLQDFPHAELSATQQEALRGYVAGGGALIAIGGADWDRLARSPLADLWPVTPTSAAPAGNTQKQAFYRRYVQPQKELRSFSLGDDLAGAPLMLTNGTLRPGAKALWGSSSPMMATRPYGAGRVVFLAGDPNQPPFSGWRGIPYLWAEVFQNTPPISSIQETKLTMVNWHMMGNTSLAEGRTDPSYGLLEGLRRVRQLKTPPVSTIAWFLALYVFFLVPVNYCVLRLFDKRELAWVTVPVIVVAFSFMSYAAALRIKGSTLLARQINIVQGSGTLNGTPAGDLQARSDSMLWLFSPRKTSYAIAGDNPRLALSHYIHSETSLNSPVTIAQLADDKPMRIEDAAVNMWDWRAFVGHAPVSTKGGIQVTAQGDAAPQVKNATPFDMKGVVLKWSGRLWKCADLKAGSTVKGQLSSQSSATGTQLSNQIANLSNLRSLFPVGGANLSEVASSALNMTLTGARSDADTLLIGWSTQPVGGLTIEDSSPAYENATLFVYEIQ
ncbi:MAG TPA: hypothetical protein VGB77_11020 [Abditibacteriaceae bacterium]|jgi:hypothetical protein